jgi:hypothetical protein
MVRLRAAIRRLYRRARHRAVRAKNAAVPLRRFQSHAAILAVIEKLTGIGRHGFDGLMAAFRASNRGLELHRCWLPVIAGQEHSQTRYTGGFGHPYNKPFRQDHQKPQ